MRKLLIAVAATAAAGGLATTTALAAGRTVKVGDFFFVRDGADTPTVTVSKGTKVTFKWVGTNPHNVHATSGPTKFRSATKGGDDYRFARTLRKKGTYRLVCDVHPATMRMTLRVK
jgi:plastocyanin